MGSGKAQAVEVGHSVHRLTACGVVLLVMPKSAAHRAG